MNGLTAIGLGLAGALAGVPVAALAYSASGAGPVRMPQRWWAGGPARPARVMATAGATGAAGAIIGAAVPPTFALPAFWVFAVLGVGLAIIDARCRRLPHRLTGALWASSGLCFVVVAATGGGAQPVIRAAGAGFATAAVLLLVALALPGQLGLGDVMFAGAVTFTLGWLSWQAAVIGILAGLLTQGVVVLAVKVFGRDQAASPMGPALLTGWLLAIALTA
ncbi:prepilin peptidase [Actinoplanes sp. NBRC 103695]|uniref:prepilin peptidase n=1 Tax=Actinoplanes sp. NBRC 103695 TaxID=3032202 RepID=UPI00255361E3|nr:prepilin peptidase [Actinoplanes sp. NBRC 103695]